MADVSAVSSTTALQLVKLLAGSYSGAGESSGIDWDALVGLAKEIGISQMLYTELTKQGIKPPAAIAERLRSIHLSGVIDGCKRHHYLDKILDMLSSAGIMVIPVKGAWLSQNAYPNIAMRGMSDIDLWISKEDVQRAIELLETIGYQVSLSSKERPQELQDALLGETLLAKSGAPFVELHWTIFAGEWLRHTSRIDEGVIRERSLPWKGEMVRQLQPEDIVIHVAVHLAVNHHMSDALLRTMMDMQMIRRNYDIDWKLVINRAVLWRVRTPVWLVGELMIRFFGQDEALSVALASVRPSALRRWFLYRFFSPDRGVAGEKITGLNKFAFLMLLVDHPVAAFGLVKQALWPDKTWFNLRYTLDDSPVWRRAVLRILHSLRMITLRKL